MADDEKDNEEHPFHMEGSSVIFDKPPSAKETTRETREREAHEFARTQVSINKRTAWFNGLLVLATFSTVAIGIWQGSISQTAASAARDAVNTAESSRRDGKAASDASSKESAKANEDTLNEMQAQIEANRKNFVDDERPYMWTNGSPSNQPPVFVPINDGLGRVLWTIHYTNYGRSPAQEVRMSGFVEASVDALKIRRRYNFSDFGPIPPGKDGFSSIYSSQPLTHQEFNTMMNSDGQIVLRLKATYTDLSRQGRFESEICLYHLSTGAAAYCPNKKANYIH